jgi:hypothetical protein
MDDGSCVRQTCTTFTNGVKLCNGVGFGGALPAAQPNKAAAATTGLKRLSMVCINVM